MNSFEIENLLKSRKVSATEETSVFLRLKKDKSVTSTDYKGFVTYRAN